MIVAGLLHNNNTTVKIYKKVSQSAGVKNGGIGEGQESEMFSSRYLLELKIMLESPKLLLAKTSNKII